MVSVECFFNLHTKCLKPVFFFAGDFRIPEHTVDGRSPAPVDIVNVPLFTRLYTSPVVVWDF